MNFKEDYPELFQFFAGYFPDADLDKLSDEDVVKNYVADCNKSERSKMELEQSNKEILKLMNEIENYWQQVGQESNRYFSTSVDALEWLNAICFYLRKETENDK